MNEDVKNQLDQIGDIVDSKIEKAFNQAQENAKGEMESSLKSEITNLTNEYNEKFENATKRMDAIEVESKKTLSNVSTRSFKIIGYILCIKSKSQPYKAKTYY